MSRKRPGPARVVVALTALTAVALAVAGTLGAAPQKAESKPTFVVGQQVSGIISLVKDSHALDGAPYNVKWAVFPFGPPEVEAVAAGQVDIGTDIGDVPPINGAAKDLGFKVVAALVPPSFKQAGNYLLVPKGSSIKTAADLKGKSVGVPFGSAAHGFLLNLVKSVHLTPSVVKFVNLVPAALQPAFKSGKVDAIVIWNPLAAVDVEQGARVVAVGRPPLDPDVGFVAGATKNLTDPKRKVLFVDLLKRLGRAYEWGSTHPDVWIKDVQKETGIDKKTATIVVTNGLIGIRYVTPAILRSEQALADTFFEAKQIPKRVDVSRIVVNVLPRNFNGK
jgi:sulfonate transport system substrate-binding protein